MKHIATLSFSLLLGAVAHAQVFQDHTRVRRLDSSSMRTDQLATVCPSGSVLSGGVCTPLIQNQGGYGRAWTSYFVGQRKCVTYPFLDASARLATAYTCAMVNGNGSITISMDGGGKHYGSWLIPTPVELAPIEYLVGSEPTNYFLRSREYVVASPVADHFSGAAPTNWTFIRR